MIIESWINKSWPSKGKFKYNYQLSTYGFPHVKEIETWVKEKPTERGWGNMGYVACNKEEDALMIVLRWS